MTKDTETADPTRRVGVLLAGGIGSRVGLDIPKQLIKVAGKTILEHTLEVMHSHPEIDEIVILMSPGHLDAVRAIVTVVAWAVRSGSTTNTGRLSFMLPSAYDTHAPALGNPGSTNPVACMNVAGP